MPIDLDRGPLIDDAWLDKTIAIPLLYQFSGPTPDGSRFCDVEEERPEARGRQSVREGIVRARWQPGFDP